MTSVLLGDLADGQDLLYTSLYDQTQRSGIAPEATVHYYQFKNNFPNIRQAIEDAAFNDGVDIINMSISPDDEGYCQNKTLSGVREAVQSATDAGVLVVVSGGNDGGRSGCSVNNYATFPDSLAVGGTEDARSLSDLDSVSIHPNSSSGTTTEPLDGPNSAETRIIDLVSNYCHDKVAASSSSNYDDVCGTSFAAPAIAGVAGLLLDWINDRGGYGGWEYDPYVLRTMLSLMGDGQTTSGYGATDEIDDSFGFGNLRFVNFDTELGANGGMGIKRGTMYEGGAPYEWPVGDGLPNYTATGWKMVALLDENLHDDSPDMTIQLIDKCSSGGGEHVLLTAEWHALKARMRLPEWAMPYFFHGRCLYVRATMNSADGGIAVYFGDYFYSNSRTLHAVD